MAQKKNNNRKTIREKQRNPKKEIAKEILKGLALGGLVAASFALPNLPQIFSLLGTETPKDRFAAKRTLKNLHNQRLVDISGDGDTQVVKITEAGKLRVRRYKIDDMVLDRPKKWDGHWRIISFDIPERFKRGRNALSRKMKELEIYPLQKSLYICPFRCRDEVDFIGEVFGIRNFIHYFLATKLDEKDEEYLKRHYDL